MIKKTILILLVLSSGVLQAQDMTYAEKLGFPKGKKVLILHVDDVGMSWDSNQGFIQASENGVANSCSVMMPCPWVPDFVHYLKKHPNVDAGLHLTLTSEWNNYRWPPLMGQAQVPGLVDAEGAMHHEAEDVVKFATADEVEKEIRAQLARAKAMGFNPTHLDSHMGTVFMSPEFLQRYIKVGIENKIPVMFPGGHATVIGAQYSEEDKKKFREAGKMIWAGGLPVLDDLQSQGFSIPKNTDVSNEKEIQRIATEYYSARIKELKPGLTMVIVHCTAPSEIFRYISGSGNVRKGDMLTMMNPDFKKFLETEGVILTTWRELKERRDKVK